MTTLTFCNLDSTRPEDGQDVWLLREGDVVSVPARYHAPTEHYRAQFSLFAGEISYKMDGAWAAMEHPENANTAGADVGG